MRLYNIHKNIEFLSYQQDLSEFYNSIDCLIVPSLEDTFNMAALEAMAHYRPVIISNNAGACEVIKEGQNGYVFDVRQNGAGNLTDRLMQFIDNKPNFAITCRKTAENYSWNRVYERVCEELRI